jgi:hypothetical protein
MTVEAEEDLSDIPGRLDDQAPGQGAGAARGPWSPGTRRWILAALALSVAAVALSVALGTHRRHDLKLDVSDEGAHYAYVVALRAGHIPVWGDRISVADRRFVDCVNLYPLPAKCGAPVPAADRYPAGGYDYEAQQPPLGYLPYLLTANPGAPPATALADARRGGVIWVGLTGLLLFAFGWVAGLDLLALAAVLATTLLAPAFTYAAATVNNDAAAGAAGALALLGWALARRRPGWGLAIGLTAGVAIGLTKGIFVAAPFALVVAGLVTEWRALGSRSGAWAALRRQLCPVAMLVASLVAYGAFVLVQDLRATTRPSVVLNALLGFSHAATLQPAAVGTGVTSLLTVFQPYVPSAPVNVVWGLAAFGSLVGMWTLRSAGPAMARARPMAAGVFAGIAALALGWPLLLFVQGHFNFGATTRYGIVLLPLIGYALVLGCRRWGLVAVGLALPLACAALQLWIGSY